jgi:Tfp pilus assembly protein PilX
MKAKLIYNGSVLLVTIFIVALFSAVVIGMLQINTEEIQIMRNQIYAAQALAIAEAGLNDAFSELRADSSWDSGFSDKVFDDGSYTVTVSGSLPNLTVESTGTSSQSFAARVSADITVGSSSPHILSINNLRVNE